MSTVILGYHGKVEAQVYEAFDRAVNEVFKRNSITVPIEVVKLGIEHYSLLGKVMEPGDPEARATMFVFAKPREKGLIEKIATDLRNAALEVLKLPQPKDARIIWLTMGVPESGTSPLMVFTEKDLGPAPAPV